MNKLSLTLLTALILCLAIGCQDKAAMAELEAIKAQTKVESQNKTLVNRYIDIINTRNYDDLKELLSPDYAVYNPSGHPEPTSRDKLIENYKGAAEAFTEFSWEIKDIVSAKDKVVARIMINGTTKAGLPGLPKSSQKFEFSMISIMRVEDGKIIEEWQEDDQLGFARQLGMELKAKERDK